VSADTEILSVLESQFARLDPSVGPEYKSTFLPFAGLVNAEAHNQIVKFMLIRHCGAMFETCKMPIVPVPCSMLGKTRDLSSVMIITWWIQSDERKTEFRARATQI
jgi:hypothetical protein